jgi:hypothetical protein
LRRNQMSDFEPYCNISTKSLPSISLCEAET